MKHILLIFLSFVSFSIFSQSLPVMRISFDGKLNNNTYVYGTMQLADDTTVVELPAKFKTRGATALNYSMKPSLNMKLRDADDNEIDSTLLGIRSCSSWILDAMAIDRINMRNRVCMDIWNEMYDLPYKNGFGRRSGTVGRFVELYINNTYKGIYCLSDRINRKLLDLKKTKVSGDTVTIRGVLYKRGTTGIGEQTVVGYYDDSTKYVAAWHDAWELSEPDEYPGKDAWAPLVEYYKNSGNPVYVTSHFDSDNIANYIMLIMAFSIGDNWGNKNMYWSVKNITDNNWYFIISPWDLDTSLGGNYKGDYYDGNYETTFSPENIFKTIQNPFSSFVDYTYKESVLRNMWINYRETYLSVDSIASKLYNYCYLFEKSGAWERQYNYWETQKYKPKYVKDLRREVQLVVEWYQDRYNIIDKYFGIEDDITNVSNIKCNTDNIYYYDLYGRKVNNPEHGIYIFNGKKIILK